MAAGVFVLCQTQFDGAACGERSVVQASGICPHLHIELSFLCASCVTALSSGMVSCSACFAGGVLAQLEPLDFRALGDDGRPVQMPAQRDAGLS